MKDKINVAEILKKCPKGMELDCTMFDYATLDSVSICGDYPIEIKTPNGKMILTKYGQYFNDNFFKCVIFPKGKTTWEGFVPSCKFKDGDIVAAETDSGLQVFILQKATGDDKGYCYIGYDFEFNEFFDAGEWVFDRLATEEEKQKFFKVIKEKCYRWNAETKTLVPDKFDINTLIPFESKVLVRDCNYQEWNGEIFTRYDNKSFNNCNFVTLGGQGWKQCIPYNDNTKHLLGKTDNCDEFYTTWSNE